MMEEPGSPPAPGPDSGRAPDAGPTEARQAATRADVPGARGTLAGLLGLAFFLLVAGWNLKRAADAPAYNWDMLGYMALALEWQEDDPLELHRTTYELARDELPREAFGSLLVGFPREPRARDPEAFHEHIAFYRSRVLYTGLVFALHKLGAPLSAATWWISLASAGLLALLTLMWAARYVPLPWAALGSAGLVSVPWFFQIASFSTPDALSAFLTCATVYALVVPRSLRWSAALSLALLLTRPDALILIGFLVASVYFLDRSESRPTPGLALLWLAGAAAVYWGVQSFGGAYGWWPLVWISFVQKELRPSELPTAPNFGQYWIILKRELQGSLGSLALLHAGWAALGLGLASRLTGDVRGWAVNSRARAVLIALLGAFATRYLLFPKFWDRLWAPFYVLVPLLALSMLAEARAARSA